LLFWLLLLTVPAYICPLILYILIKYIDKKEYSLW
jgi:hypothetical protein